jgi:hypothetical protein
LLRKKRLIRNEPFIFYADFRDYNLADQYQNLGLYNQSKELSPMLLSDQKLLKVTIPN